MMRYVSRWQFDLALVLGLLGLVWTTNFNGAKPLWYQDLKSNLNVEGLESRYQFLGFSDDSQSIYTSAQFWKHGWSGPIIQQWNAKTGALLKENALQISETDYALLKKAKQEQTHTALTLTGNQQLLMRITGLSEKESITLFSKEGQPLFSQGPFGSNLLVHPFHVTTDQHTLALTRDVSSTPSPPTLLDLHTGKTVTTLNGYANYVFVTMQMLPGDHYYLVYWVQNGNFVPSWNDRKTIVDIYQTADHRKVGSIELPSANHSSLFPLSESNWICCSTRYKNGAPRLLSVHQLSSFHFNSETGKIEPVLSHSMNGMTFKDCQLLQKGSRFLVRIDESEKYPQTPVGWKRIVLDWLVATGYQYDLTSRISVQVFDIATGQLLREAKRIPCPFAVVDPACTILVGLAHTPGGMILQAFPLLPVPSRLLWISWILILAWPFRFWIARKSRITSQPEE